MLTQMRNRKPLIGVLLAICLAVALSGCLGKKSKSKAPPAGPGIQSMTLTSNNAPIVAATDAISPNAFIDNAKSEIHIDYCADSSVAVVPPKLASLKYTTTVSAGTAPEPGTLKDLTGGKTDTITLNSRQYTVKAVAQKADELKLSEVSSDPAKRHLLSVRFFYQLEGNARHKAACVNTINKRQYNFYVSNRGLPLTTANQLKTKLDGDQTKIAVTTLYVRSDAKRAAMLSYTDVGGQAAGLSVLKTGTNYSVYAAPASWDAAQGAAGPAIKVIDVGTTIAANIPDKGVDQSKQSIFANGLERVYGNKKAQVFTLLLDRTNLAPVKVDVFADNTTKYIYDAGSLKGPYDQVFTLEGTSAPAFRTVDGDVNNGRARSFLISDVPNGAYQPGNVLIGNMRDGESSINLRTSIVDDADGDRYLHNEGGWLTD